ncbi:hypothetical protein RND71_009859 [Anisodus tanguticus]|uniref:Uncharacterized protein n=1 Tax=Anisodus tanguticus TaxID=243964 RepID=A0AAE1SIT8_9SOLA|nr:hypothetical protein RND71_009859 [Anisodus tanguticus]
MGEEYKQMLPPPPRRGQIKMKILNSLIKFATEFVSGGSTNKGKSPNCVDSVGRQKSF